MITCMVYKNDQPYKMVDFMVAPNIGDYVLITNSQFVVQHRTVIGQDYQKYSLIIYIYDTN